MNEIQNSALTPSVTRAEAGKVAQSYRPLVDIYDAGEQVTILMDVPGAKADAIDVGFERGVMTVRAAVEPRPGDSARFLLQEYGVGHYQRQFRLSDDVDPERVSAAYRDGVLTVQLPKADRARSRKVEVRSA